MISSSLNTKADLERALWSLLAPLKDHYVLDGIHLGYSGSSYSPRVARLEAWSRMLWGIVPLLAGGGTYPLLDLHREILIRCTDPGSPHYWGAPANRDQRLVEMAPLAFALILAKDWFWDPLAKREKANLYRWLSTIQYRELPTNNWHFFRILVCTAFRYLDLPVDEEAEAESLRIVEDCYRGNGWYIDGTNATYDLYNPSGFHFYGLLYAKFLSEWVQRLPGQFRSLKDQADASIERARRFTERATLFAPQYLAWFREDGSFVPFGRSLTYRFVAASFFSACAYAELPSLSMGVLKGVILRHLRYWFNRPILDSEGILTIGYGYPNLVLAEQYNAPGSPYWGLKTFLTILDGKRCILPRSTGSSRTQLDSGSACPMDPMASKRLVATLCWLCLKEMDTGGNGDKPILYGMGIGGRQAPGITVSFPWAASRIVDLSPSQRMGNNRNSIKPVSLPRSADLLYPEPNLNVLEPSVVVPVLKGTIEAGITLWACVVRAGDPESVLNDDIPVLHIAPDGTLSLSHESIQAPLRFFIGALE